MDIVHVPVLPEETLSLLAPEAPEGEGVLLVDATLGEGGHSELFLTRFPAIRVAGVDADPVLLDRASRRLAPFGARFSPYRAWFDEFFTDYPVELDRPDLVLLDLGISMYHYQGSGRGFSFREDEPLDMRLSEEAGPSAADLVNGLAEGELADLIFRYGEERYSRRIARRIVEERKTAPIRSASGLAGIIEKAVPAEYRRGRIHAATRTFQALRIAANRELDRLPAVLERAVRRLRVGGKIGVISFHSLEDRMVKRFFRDMNRDCICPPEAPICTCEGRHILEPLNRKPVQPSEEESRRNPASRSAKLRTARKVSEEAAA